MTMDKLFDGSDAHLLPGNAELIARLREYHNTDLEYGGFGVQEAVDAANALEAADKRIAELEAEVDHLYQVCRDAYEVWAGSNGIPEPITCVEAYMLQLLIQMRDEVKRGLKCPEC